MAGRGVVPNQKRKLDISSPHSNSSFLGSSGVLNFGAGVGVNGSSNSFFQSFDQVENGDQYFDEYFNQSEKKRRISTNQLEFLEKSFEVDNKLEPERKVQIAKELGLQPRQIAIWFQNRKARCKTKQLETDYEALHASYTSLKNDYSNLLEENEKLKTKVIQLKCDFQVPSDETSKEAVPDMIPDQDKEYSKVASKNKEQYSLAQSDVTSVDSPRLIHSFRLESGHDHYSSCHVFEPDQLDLSHPPLSSCYYGFPVEDHAFNFWSY